MSNKSQLIITYDNATPEQRCTIERLIDRDLVDQGSLVEMLLRAEVFSYADIHNSSVSVCSECMAMCDRDEECTSCHDNDFKTDCESVEIFDWYFLSSNRLRDKLVEFGEPVLTNDHGSWWGRTCAGQSIVLDTTFWHVYQSAL